MHFDEHLDKSTLSPKAKAKRIRKLKSSNRTFERILLDTNSCHELAERWEDVSSTERRIISGGQSLMEPLGICADLVVDHCPLGCDNCKSGHKIVCRCIKCGHSQERRNNGSN
jgi:hypothetical protein